MTYDLTTDEARLVVWRETGVPFDNVAVDEVVAADGCTIIYARVPHCEVTLVVEWDERGRWHAEQVEAA